MIDFFSKWNLGDQIFDLKPYTINVRANSIFTKRYFSMKTIDKTDLEIWS